jgi:pentose-5-phosphate-3-epimerase
VNSELAARIESAGMRLAGSLLAVNPALRLDAASELWARGAWAHADVISGGYGSRPSVTLDEIRTLASVGGPIDVHLMVDDVAGWLAALPTGLSRITIQSERLQSGLTELITLARQRASTVWVGVDTGVAPPPPAVAEADGVLHMLVPPAVDGHSLDPDRLAALRTDTFSGTGVDGGVRAGHVDAIARAGAQYVVVGRSLFTAPTAPKENAR